MNALLQDYRSPDGNVDYTSLKQNPKDVEKIVELIESTDMGEMTPNERKAFILNTYNFLVIHGIVAGGIEFSVKEDQQFFEQSRLSLSGDSSSLDELEHKELRAVYADPRIHFALNCGAASCPPLNQEIFQESKLESQLEELTKLALNDTSHVMIKKKERVVKLSPIFQWYEEDFSAAGGVFSFINKYRSDTLLDDYTIVYREYDWSLNSD